MLRALIGLMISSSLKCRDESLELVLYNWISETVLLFANMLQWEAKKLLKRFVFPRDQKLIYYFVVMEEKEISLGLISGLYNLEC